jgi:hypothetical protein
MTPTMHQPLSSRTTVPFLSTPIDWVRTNKTGLLVNIVAAPPGALFVWLSYHALLPIFSLIVPRPSPASHIQSTGLSVWLLSAFYFVVGAGSFRLFSYIRLYRYCTDKFGGIRWRWWYSVPFGRVIHIRGCCQVCREPFDERTFLIFGCSNYKCENCGTITDETPRNWPAEIERRVHERFTKCPNA